MSLFSGNGSTGTASIYRGYRTLIDLPNYMMFWLVIGISAAIRFLHHAYLLNDPLYNFPLGGHTPYFLLAQGLVDGVSGPESELRTLSSPLFSYYIAAMKLLVGDWIYFALRVVSTLADSLVAALIFTLSSRAFSKHAAVIAALLYALFGPAVFFGTELTPVPIVNLLIYTSLTLLANSRLSVGNSVLAGSLFGLATLLRSNLIIFIPCLLIALIINHNQHRVIATFLVGLALLLLGSLFVDRSVHGAQTIISFGGGHNFYLGHNPEAQAGYTLPLVYDGNIFQSMKSLAEQTEQREFKDTEVSPYFMKKAFYFIAHHPLEELTLSARKLSALFKDYEFTNYANFYYYKEHSAILRVLPTFGFIVPFSLVGLLFCSSRRSTLLIVPIAATVVTIVAFFFIARLRAPMLPAIAAFAGAGIAHIATHLASLRHLVIHGLLLLCSFYLTFHDNPQPSISNELNKRGVVERNHGNLKAAESSFLKAHRTTPQDLAALGNLASLYSELGKKEEARAYRKKFKELEYLHKERGRRFSDHLKAIK